jgi:hypothetical protein
MRAALLAKSAGLYWVRSAKPHCKLYEPTRKNHRFSLLLERDEFRRAVI